MARTFETSTATSRLGITDPDRGNFLHDFACQYLAEPGPSKKLLAKILNLEESEFEIAEQWPRFEHHLTKGGGDYQRTVGFVDLVVGFDLSKDGKNIFRKLAFEVKTTPCLIGDVIRQVALYRDCTDMMHADWVLATTFPLSESDVSMLASSKILHVTLGEKFKAFHEASKSREASSLDL